METLQSNIDVVWRPIPNSSQELALDTRCQITLYTGARGPGKTDTQLMRFRRRVGVGYGAFWRGIIFDKEYKNLEDIITKSKRWFNAFNDGAKFLESASSLKWVWPSGEELLFRVAEKESDYWKYHGHEYPYLGWNELTKYPTSALFDMMMSTNRSSFRPEDYPKAIDGDIYNKTGQIVFVNDGMRYELPPIPLEVFATCNPYGPGHGWVKRKFIDVAPYGTVVRKQVKVISPQTKKEEIVERTQVAIFGSYVENIYLDPQYIATLNEEKDPNRKKAWLTGDWNIVAGGALDDVWNEQVHVLPRFVIPESWRIDRCMDWGSSHPFWIGWFAEANGEEATIIHNGQEFSFCPVPGSLVLLHEYYGTEEIGSNKGLKLSAADVAKNAKKYENALALTEWISGPVWAGPADNQIRDVRESDVETIEEKMAKHGITWIQSDKSPGSRKIGLQLLRDRLESATRREGPGIYFMEHCRAAISILPTLPRDPDNLDDVDTDAEDHPYDAIRYRVLKSSNKTAKSFKLKMPT